MNRTIGIASLITIFFGSLLSALSQSGQPGQPDSEALRRQIDSDVRRRKLILADINRSSDRESAERLNAPRPKIDKATQARIDLMRQISQKDAATYLELLKSKDAGIFKLFPNLNCISERVIKVNDECADFVPLSSHFSFRHNAYIEAPFQDIEYVDGVIRAHGFFTQGILLDLRDTSIETVALDNPAISAIQTVGTGDSMVDEARATERDLTNGVSVGGYVFTNYWKPYVGHTFALRVIAYKLNRSLPPMSDDSTAIETKFHSLEYDKRLDSTIVFRVLSRDDKGGVTIVWKELKRADAPKLAFAKGQPLSDFK
ncbi:MAG TPA: hypothetical protein VGO43_04005 [Pyrinomonadaceae bacterium]|nr:hypothetical protein [Pyrinomonadaceae bacterium]